MKKLVFYKPPWTKLLNSEALRPPSLFVSALLKAAAVTSKPPSPPTPPTPPTPPPTPDEYDEDS